jgi:hypothetical protein
VKVGEGLIVKLKIILMVGLVSALAVTASCSGNNKNAANGQANKNLADANAPVPAGQNPTTAPGSVPTGADPTQGVTPSPLTTAASDSSTITQEMDKTGTVTSTRVFSANKNISKVVVVTGSQDNKLTRTVTVYDLAGKPHTLPETEADAVMKENGDEIAKSAGMHVINSGGGSPDVRDPAKKVAAKAGNAADTAADRVNDGVDKAKVKIPKP